MVFNKLFQRFIEAAPACVMHRALMENIFAPERLDAVFHEAAEIQYERELLFSTLVELLGQIVCRVSENVRAAYLAQCDRVVVTLTAVYEKLKGVELGTSQALVRYTAGAAGDLIDRCQGRRPPLLKGYRTRILDGNHLGKTNHRLSVLRNTAAGALPGQSLVLLDPQRMVIDEVVLCEDGHAQERSLLDQVVPLLERDDLLIADRNFCTLAFLFGIMACQARFLIRQHRRMPWKSQGKARYVGRCETGCVYEETIELRDPATGRTTHVRRITIRLKSPTVQRRSRNSPAHQLARQSDGREGGRSVPPPLDAGAGLQRTDDPFALRTEHARLSQGGVVLVLRRRVQLQCVGGPEARCGVHGEEKVEKEVSNLRLTSEIQSIYGGMMVVLPPCKWRRFQTLNSSELAAQLIRWARGMDLGRYRKHPRGPKKPKPTPPNARSQHVATSQLIEQQQLNKNRKRKIAFNSGP